jgi:predicted metal-dependent enzyme (double-stranded beta helix superfamily)
MAYAFEDFTKDAHDFLTADPGPAGREKVRNGLATLLRDRAELDARIRPDAGTQVLHHDPDTGIYVLAHPHPKEGRRGPHDHGPSWAIYGVLDGETETVEWARKDDGSREGYAEIEPARKYTIREGEAYLYNEGTPHSVYYPEGTMLIRVTGTDLNTVTVLRYNPERNQVVADDRARHQAAAS